MSRHCLPGLLILLVCLAAAAPARADGVDPQVQAQAVRGLIERLLPNHADRFALEIIPAEDGRDTFEIEAADGRVTLRGSNGVSLASALNWYLKYHCNAHVSWCGDQLDLPDPLPAVSPAVRIVSPYQHRYYLNYCTFSYTMAWWDWADWERQIDWMALQGINMPLAIVGQEAVWQQVYRDMGLSQDDLDDFFVGPAYLAWGWMGNIDGWGGPLSQHWIDGQRQLQQKILERQRSFGMTPVLPAFTGHVPAALARRFPDANVKQLPGWGGFEEGTWMLDPADPRFGEIGTQFLKTQIQMYGTDHIYSADTFNENEPPSHEPQDLAASSRAVFQAMQAADPQAVWLMQGWLFHMDAAFWTLPRVQGYLSGVPDDRMIVLDLHAEAHPVWPRVEAFYGKPWIWCGLHDFGGRNPLWGSLASIAQNPPAALASADRGRLAGLGITTEAIGHNPVYYELLAEMGWRSQAPDLDAWIRDYAHRRYGKDNDHARQAWQILRQTVYATEPDVSGLFGLGTIIASRPTLDERFRWTRDGGTYDPATLLEAWVQLQQAADELGGADPFRYDLVDVARQVLADGAEAMHQQIVEAFEAGDAQRVAAGSEQFLELLRDMDRLLATRPEFLLGRWVADARAKGQTQAEQRHYEWNARNLVTLWGDQDSPLHDYAHRQWSGLVGGFYHERWRQFFEAMKTALASDQPLDVAATQRQIAAWEKTWTRTAGNEPATPSGDSLAVSKRLLEKYHPILVALHE